MITRDFLRKKLHYKTCRNEMLHLISIDLVLTTIVLIGIPQESASFICCIARTSISASDAIVALRSPSQVKREDGSLAVIDGTDKFFSRYRSKDLPIRRSKDKVKAICKYISLKVLLVPGEEPEEID